MKMNIFDSETSLFAHLSNFSSSIVNASVRIPVSRSISIINKLLALLGYTFGSYAFASQSFRPAMKWVGVSMACAAACIFSGCKSNPTPENPDTFKLPFKDHSSEMTFKYDGKTVEMVFWSKKFDMLQARIKLTPGLGVGQNKTLYQSEQRFGGIREWLYEDKHFDEPRIFLCYSR